MSNARKLQSKYGRVELIGNGARQLQEYVLPWNARVPAYSTQQAFKLNSLLSHFRIYYSRFLAEIDRVMKKVDEGELLFDEIWEKVYSAEQQNQKEKYEMDLKKEIKKLQRLRDQIKTWISSAEVKDKGDLVEARKRIEQKMEQFKICEKETKTKTYSKEGLAREERLDPAEEAKLNTTGWLGDYIERLRQMVEEHDFELEKLVSGKGKKTNKTKIEELQNHVLNHKNHISKLEGVIRLVNNERLDVDTVDAFQEDLDYYMDSYADEDYMSAYDEDFFYEPLGLEDLDVVNVDRLTQATTKKDKDDTETLSSKGSSKDKKGKSKAVASVIPLTIGRARVSKADKKNAEKEAAKEEEKATPVKPSPSPPVPNGAPAPVVRSPPPPATAAPGASMAAILKRESEQEKERQQKVSLAVISSSRMTLISLFDCLSRSFVSSKSDKQSRRASSKRSRCANRKLFVYSRCNNNNNSNKRNRRL